MVLNSPLAIAIEIRVLENSMTTKVTSLVCLHLSMTFSSRSLERSKNEEYFIDWIHVTEAGNRIYSDKILKLLKSKLNDIKN